MEAMVIFIGVLFCIMLLIAALGSRKSKVELIIRKKSDDVPDEFVCFLLNKAMNMSLEECKKGLRQGEIKLIVDKTRANLLKKKSVRYGDLLEIIILRQYKDESYATNNVSTIRNNIVDRCNLYKNKMPHREYHGYIDPRQIQRANHILFKRYRSFWYGRYISYGRKYFKSRMKIR